MVLNIKILILFFFLSFVLLLYKLNKHSRVILIETSDRVLENVEINERHQQPSPVLVNYFSDLLNKRPNLLTFPLLMTTSFIYNKKECINEESSELGHIKQTIELKKLSMSIALLVFLIIGIEWNNLDVFSSAYQKGFSITLPLGIHSGIILGYDHLSIPFILLLSFVFPVVFMSNWTTVKIGEMKYYLTTILSSHYFLIIVFLVIDILMFYISFEIILPFFFILLGMFGGVQKFRAMYYLFLYTLWGSLFMLLEFLTKIGENGTGVMGLLEDLQLSSSWGILGSLGIILAFSIKTPIVPFHLWLPLAHGDANVSGSIVLASIVLKMALYGFIRILIFILLLAFSSTQLSMFSIFIFSLLFASATTMRQNDLKVLVAYSSVAHMGSTLLGGFSNNQFGIFGSILFSIAHGVVSPALFIFVGALFYDRIGSRIINYLKGLVFLYPVAVAMLLPVVFGNMGTPLTANFVAELECILATFMVSITMGMLAAISIILSACYSIYMFNRISTGSISPYLATAPDTNKKEFSMLIPLIIIMILLGIIPSLVSKPIDLGLSNFLLDGSNSFLNILVGTLSLLLSIPFYRYMYEITKLLINIMMFKLKNLILNIRNNLDNGLKLSGSWVSHPSNVNNDQRSNSESFSKDQITNIGKTDNLSQPKYTPEKIDTNDPNLRHIAQGQPSEVIHNCNQNHCSECLESARLTEDADQATARSRAVSVKTDLESRLEDGEMFHKDDLEQPNYIETKSETAGDSRKSNDHINGGTGETNKMNSTEIEWNQYNVNTVVDKEVTGGLIYKNFDTSSDYTNLEAHMEVRLNPDKSDLYFNEFIPLDNAFINLCIRYKEEGMNWGCKAKDIKIPFSGIEDSPFIPESVIDYLMIPSCGFAILMAMLYIINQINKRLTKSKWEELDNNDQDYTKIKFINVDFVKSDSDMPEARKGTSNNEAKDKGNVSNSGANSEADEYPLEGQWGREGLSNIQRTPNPQPAANVEPVASAEPIDIIDPRIGVRIKKTGELRVNRPRGETELPPEYKEWREIIKKRKIFNEVPDMPDTPPGSPEIGKDGQALGKVEMSEQFSSSTKLDVKDFIKKKPHPDHPTARRS